MVNAEVHYFDSNSNAAVGSSGTVANMSSMGQGDTNSTRTGMSVKCKSFYLRLTADIHASATVTHCRYLILIDHEVPDAGTTASVTDVLQTATIDSPLKIGNGKRFTVLRDKQFGLNTDGRLGQQRKEFIKVSHHMKWDPAGDAREGQILVLFISSEPTNTPTFNWYGRFAFYDN